MGVINAWIQKLLPRDKVIIDLVYQASSNMKQASAVYRQLGQSTSVQDFQKVRQRMTDIEHNGDNLTHQMFDELNRTFITPFDRQDLMKLISLIDDVVDYLHEVTETIVLYSVPELTRDMKEMIGVGSDAIQEACFALEKIKQLHKPQVFKQHMIKIHELENKGDAYFRNAIASLLQPGIDPLHFFRTERVLREMEGAIDRVEDLANIIDTIVIKHG